MGEEAASARALRLPRARRAAIYVLEARASS